MEWGGGMEGSKVRAWSGVAAWEEWAGAWSGWRHGVWLGHRVEWGNRVGWGMERGGDMTWSGGMEWLEAWSGTGACVWLRVGG